jgi:hypothetical protein
MMDRGRTRAACFVLTSQKFISCHSGVAASRNLTNTISGDLQYHEHLHIESSPDS